MNSTNSNELTFSKYQEQATTTAIYGAGSKVVYPALGLAGETGEVLEKVKKVLRDKNGIFDEESKKAIKKEMGDVLWYIAALSTDLGLNLTEVAQENLDKLFSRRERGVIQGSGDNR